MIKTTLYMHKNIRNALDEASEALCISRSKIIKLLLMEIKLDKFKFIKLFSQVTYQDSDVKENWKNFHISLTPSEYEHFIDMRKLFKMSVSKIVAFAVSQYLSKLLSKKNHRDNCFFPVYCFGVENLYGVDSFVITWELPKYLLKNPIKIE